MTLGLESEGCDAYPGSAGDTARVSMVLDELLVDVSRAEARAENTQQRGGAATALRALRGVNVSINPADRLVPLPPQAFEAAGVALNPAFKQLTGEFDFYYVTASVSLGSASGTQLSRLHCELQFGSGGPHQPVVISLFPDTQWTMWRPRQPDCMLALDGNLAWNLGVDAAGEAQTNAPPTLRYRIMSKAHLQGVIAEPQLCYPAILPGSVRTGTLGTSACRWDIRTVGLSHQALQQFGIILRVPKTSTSIEMRSSVVVEPDSNWLAESLKPVLPNLNQHWQRLFSDASREGPGRLGRVATERCTFDLRRNMIVPWPGVSPVRESSSGHQLTPQQLAESAPTFPVTSRTLEQIVGWSMETDTYWTLAQYIAATHADRAKQLEIPVDAAYGASVPYVKDMNAYASQNVVCERLRRDPSRARLVIDGVGSYSRAELVAHVQMQDAVGQLVLAAELRNIEVVEALVAAGKAARLAQSA